ncbi:MAG TPA: hypothetical protein VGQ22_22730 [Steroidobacteraceae bacterium]|jgi:hypothetical protein|nr:hypothetical protein [Steroidobacteraceae bacterium]
MTPAIRNGLIIAWLGALSVASIVLAIQPADSAQAPAAAHTADYDELTVQRINIVEPNGNPRVIISSKQRMAGLYWGGKEYQHPTRDEGGFLFFNDDGDEVGGMIFKSHKQGDKSAASASMLFDQYKQGETLGLIYGEENRQREAGLRVWDQPDIEMLPAIALSDQLARATTEAQRAELNAQLKKMAEEMRGKGYFTERFFAGKQLGEAVLKLADAQGHPRLVLKVDPQGQASIEFLDAAGKTTNRLAAVK